MRQRRGLLVYAVALCILFFSAYGNHLFANSNEGEALDEYSPTEKKDEIKKITTYPSKALMIDKTKGGRKEYDTASLMLNGKMIESDVPAILYKVGNETRTLVPIRVISEKLGGEVKWEEKEQIVKIFYQGMIVQLKIDDTNALINGVSQPLPSSVPAKLMSYIDIQRTFVPVRFISEAFGAKVDWDNENRIVMITRKQRSEVTEKEPSQTLVSMEFNSSSNPKSLKLNFQEEMKQDVTDFYLHADNHNKKDRLVVDISDTIMGLKNEPEYNEVAEQYIKVLSDKEINTLRSGQFGDDGSVTRVVLDLNVRQTYEIKKEKNALIIELKEDKTSSIIDRSQGPREDMKRVREFIYYEIIKPLEFSILSFDPSSFGSITLQNADGGLVNLSFPKTTFIYEDYHSVIDDEFVSEIGLEELDDSFKLNIKLKQGVKAYLNPNNSYETRQELIFERAVPLVNPEGIVVGIDPGHGGPDPGAIGSLDGIDTSEVDVLNNIIPLLKAKLEAKGYNVRLARDEDIDMSLEARTKYAELIGARIFVSLHANASESPKAHGIETFKNSAVPESGRLATCIQEEMIRLSGERDRGVKDYNLFITRESLMPATLVELGFVTSPSDLKKLRDSKHLDVLAEGIMLGIERYFNEE